MSKGKHHRHAKGLTATGTTVLAAAVIAAACGGTATAAPSPGDTTPAPSTQGGVTTAPPNTQGGVTTAPPATQGGVTTAPAAPWVPVPSEYQQVPSKPIPNYDYDTNTYVAPAYPTYVAPIDYSQLHLPTAIDTPTPLIIAPRDTLRVGNYHVAQPNWVSDDTLDRTNATTGAIEAQVTDLWISTGIPADQAQRLAAAQIAGVGGGVIVGALAAGVPAALVGGTVGGLLGGTIGGIVGANVGNVVLVPGVGWVPGGIVGTAGGAAAGVAIGAAVAGIPAALVGGLVGGTAGFITGTAYGDGQGGEPIEIDLPDIGQPEITTQTEDTLQSWETNPIGAVAATTVRDAYAFAPVLDAQIRDAVTALPGGEQAVTGFDQVVTDFQKATEIPGLPLGMITGAIGTGIPA